jgi:hypothetical protein
MGPEVFRAEHLSGWLLNDVETGALPYRRLSRKYSLYFNLPEDLDRLAI